jgi:hypothetical protein
MLVEHAAPAATPSSSCPPEAVGFESGRGGGRTVVAVAARPDVDGAAGI